MTIKLFISKIIHKISSFKDIRLCFRKLNALEPLHLKTYDGGNEGLHPSCLYFSEGWNGYKFWFVFTPYKDMNDAIENPCIYVSQNGESFEPIDSANPLDNITLIKEQEYNSDPELVYNSDLNRIECWWRRVQRHEYPLDNGKNREIIYRKYTYDGIKWSDKEEILNLKNPFNETRRCISPALIYDNGIYRMWCSSANDIDGKHRTIDYYEMSAGKEMSLKSRYELKKGTISHLDVFYDEGKYWLIGNDILIKGSPLKMYSFISPIDAEVKYEGIVLTKGKKGNWDDRIIYRPSMVKVEEKLWLYYSAYRTNPKTQNHVGLVKIRDIKQMVKCFLQ